MEIKFALLSIPLLPLIGFFINALIGKKLAKWAVHWIACLTTGLSFLVAIWLFFQFCKLPQPSLHENYFLWIKSGQFAISCDFLLDSLSMVMVLTVTGVGFLIHLYSIGYMWEEGGYYRYFAYLNLFMFAMLILVLAGNFLLMFVGWEGVGLCSYLLIGFYFHKKSAADAGKKAFIVNRIGDFGFVVGMLLIFSTFGSLDFQSVFDQAASYPVESAGGVLTIITLLLFIGAIGKSAQLPLYVWLPDAMEGPTPVSALIHAATMVTAGVYMVTRSYVLYSRSPQTLFWVSLVGVITALFAATIGVFQRDIKRVLAYSTVSQLGYMFTSLGVAAFSAGIFHLVTHAFFKALLFLGSGSVILSFHHEQDMQKMGGLRKYIPLTWITMGIGTVAISGVLPFSGFFSKDEILWQVFSSKLNGHRAFYVAALCGVMITSFYMFRLMLLTFHGNARTGNEENPHVKKTPPTMSFVLVTLAVLSIFGGCIGLPELLGPNLLKDFLKPVFIHLPTSLTSSTNVHINTSSTQELVTTLISLFVAAFGLVLAYIIYKIKFITPEKEATLGKVYRLIYNKYFVDEVYETLIVRPLRWISEVICWKFMDIGTIDGTVNGLSALTRSLGGLTAKIQNGFTRSYLGWLVVGVLGIGMYLFLLLR